MLRVYCASAKGAFRSENQDTCLSGTHTHVVCDGVGSRPCPEVASLVAAQTFVREGDKLHPNAGGRALLTLLHQTNSRVYQENDTACTTLVGVWIPRPEIDDTCWCCSVGDSRAYLLVLGPPARDQWTLMTEDDVDVIGGRRFLFSWIGRMALITGERCVQRLSIPVGYALLLCSDGCWESLAALGDLLDAVLSSAPENRQDALEALIVAARDLIGDDATALLICHDP